MQNIISILTTPVVFFNMFAGIIGGLWLLIIGDFVTFGIGLAILFGGGFIFSVLMVPSLLIGVPLLAAKGHVPNFVLKILALIPLALTYLAIGLFCVFVFMFFVDRISYETSAWPYALTGFAASTATIRSAATQEARSGNDSGVTSALFATLGGIVMFLITIIHNAPPDSESLILGFSIPMLISFLIQSIILLFVYSDSDF